MGGKLGMAHLAEDPVTLIPRAGRSWYRRKAYVVRESGWYLLTFGIAAKVQITLTTLLGSTFLHLAYKFVLILL